MKRELKRHPSRRIDGTDPGPSADLIKATILLIVAFLLLLVDNIGYWLPRDLFSDGLSPWVLSDWLINYSSGFVRRGLSGELIEIIRPFLPPKMAVGLLAWGAFLLLTAGYLRLILRVREFLSTLALLGLLFLPSLLPFYLYDHAAFGRKETVGLLLVLWHLLILERCPPLNGTIDGNAYLRRLWPLSIVALPIHTLMHEGMALWFGSVHLFLTSLVLRSAVGFSRQRGLLITGVMYLPLALVFTAVIVFGRGSPEDARNICLHWADVGVFTPQNCADAQGAMHTIAPSIDALGWSFSKGKAVAASALPLRALVLWLVVLPILGIATLAVGSMASCSIVAGRPSEQFFDWVTPPASVIAVLFFALPLMLPFPIYVVAHDYGRWFAIACINYAMLSLSPEVVRLACRRPGAVQLKSGFERTRQPVPYNWRAFTIKTVFLLLCSTAVYLPHCCAAFHIMAPSLRTIIENFTTILSNG